MISDEEGFVIPDEEHSLLLLKIFLSAFGTPGSNQLSVEKTQPQENVLGSTGHASQCTVLYNSHSHKPCERCARAWPQRGNRSEGAARRMG